MQNIEIQRYLALFDLEEDFNERELKKSYRILVNVWHPDRLEHNQEFRANAEKKIKEINNGYQVLKNYLKNRSELKDQHTDEFHAPKSTEYKDNTSQKGKSTSFNERQYNSPPTNPFFNYFKKDDDIILNILVTTGIFIFFLTKVEAGSSIFEDIFFGAILYVVLFCIVKLIINKLK